MKRFLAPAIIAVGALAAGGITLAAAASDDGNDTAAPAAADASSSTPDSSSPSTATVNTAEIEGLGTVLTDADGRVLYAADEESDPDVVCTDACEEFWAPLDAGDEAPTGASGVTELDVAERPDGSQQVTYDGHRLYTFTQEGPGEASGEGFSDTFGGQRFTWHAVVVDETAATDSTPTATSADNGTATGGIDDYPGY
jgi:predicted lipoprotein with Yx(FWY)xxD motif